MLHLPVFDVVPHLWCFGASTIVLLGFFGLSTESYQRQAVCLNAGNKANDLFVWLWGLIPGPYSASIRRYQSSHIIFLGSLPSYSPGYANGAYRLNAKWSVWLELGNCYYSPRLVAADKAVSRLRFNRFYAAFAVLVPLINTV